MFVFNQGIFLAAFLDILLGIFVLIKNPRSGKNIAYFLFALAIGIWSFEVFYFVSAANDRSATLWLRIISSSLVIIPIVFHSLALTFSDGGSKKGALNRAIPLYLLVILVYLLGWVRPDFYVIRVTLNEWGNAPLFGPGYYIYSFIYAGLIFHAFWVLYRSLRQKKLNSIDMNINRYVFYSMLVAIGFGSIFNWLFPLLNLPNYVWIGPYSLFIVIGTTAYAITKHRLMDISVLISRTAAYILTVTFLGGIYLAMLLAYRYYVSQFLDSRFFVLTLVYGVFVGEFFQRLRLHIQTTADKVILKGKYNYSEVLMKVSHDLSKAMSIEEINRTLAEDLKEYMDVGRAEVRVVCVC